MARGGPPVRRGGPNISSHAPAPPRVRPAPPGAGPAKAAGAAFGGGEVSKGQHCQAARLRPRARRPRGPQRPRPRR
eukprot:1775915-Alexandrium_andersonii.AAC.1